MNWNMNVNAILGKYQLNKSLSQFALPKVEVSEKYAFDIYKFHVFL